MRLKVADNLGFIDSFTMWHFLISDHGNGDPSFERPLAKLVAELTAVILYIFECSAEKSAYQTPTSSVRDVRRRENHHGAILKSLRYPPLQLPVLQVRSDQSQFACFGKL